jgi:hypothetical protein
MSKQELKPLWLKTNYLLGFNFPNYKNSIMVAPFIKLTIGDLFMNHPGKFDSVTISYLDDAPWEIVKDNNTTIRIPLVWDITIDFTPIYENIPEIITKHYSGIPDDWMVESNSTFLE